jgi:hypothetical protein
MGGPAGSYAREMERLSAKESLLLAVRFSVCSFFFYFFDFMLCLSGSVEVLIVVIFYSVLILNNWVPYCRIRDLKLRLIEIERILLLLLGTIYSRIPSQCDYVFTE